MTFADWQGRAGDPPLPLADVDEVTVPRIRSVHTAQARARTQGHAGDTPLPLVDVDEATAPQMWSGRPTVSYEVDLLDTLTDLQAPRLLPAYPYWTEGVEIDEQITLILPRLQPASKAALTSAASWESANYASPLGKLLKSSGIYAIASFVSPLISLVLAPFLTKHLSHADYGALAVLNTTIALLVGVTQFGLNNAFIRAYSCDYESRSDRLRVVSTLVVLLLLVSVPTTLVLLATAPWISVFLFKSPLYSNPVKIAALVILLQNLTVPGLTWMRVENRAAPFSALSVVNLLITLVASVVFVGIMRLGISGSLLAVGGGYGFVVLCTLPVVLIYAGLRLRIDIARNLLSFGLPLVSGYVTLWVLQLSDRFLLSRLGSLAQTASYSVAYTLGGILGALVLAPFSLAWPTAMFAIAKRDDAPAVFKLVFRWYSLGLLSCTFAFSLVSIYTLLYFFPPAYHSAASIIPIIAVSTMFYGIFDIFTIGIGVRRKTWLAVLYAGVSALVNIGCNLILIPLYGSIGAAVATLIAYALLAAIAYAVNQRIYPIPFEIGLFCIALSIGTVFYIGATILAQNRELYIAAAIYIGAFSLYSICLVLLGRPFAWIGALVKKRGRILFNAHTFVRTHSPVTFGGKK